MKEHKTCQSLSCEYMIMKRKMSSLHLQSEKPIRAYIRKTCVTNLPRIIDQGLILDNQPYCEYGNTIPKIVIVPASDLDPTGLEFH